MLQERTVPEQIRDLYIDALVDVILTSEYNGKIRLCPIEDLPKEMPALGNYTEVLHITRTTPETFAQILQHATGNFDMICIYL